jgi:glucitol operon activator protein
MAFWQIALLALALAWAVQAFGTWSQVRHYRTVMSSISARYADGHLGAGNARGRFGKGVIAIVVADQQDVVRELLIMEGRSVFAKFRALPEFAGRTLDALAAEPPFPAKESGRNQAVARAIEQLRLARSNAAAAGPAAAVTSRFAHA